jgi:hypothetical protein
MGEFNMLLNEEFLQLYEELGILNEANEDKDRFIAKFGKEAFETFWNKKQLIKNKGISVDITYHVAKTSREEMYKILDSISDATRKAKLDAEGRPIPENSNNFEIVYDGPHYTVYNPKDFVASIYCANGGRWCTAGGYAIPEGKVKVSQAAQYFNQYVSRGITLYYFIGKQDSKNSFALAYQKDNGTGQFFNYQDQEIRREDIPYIDEVTISGIDLDKVYSGYVCEECGDRVLEGDEYIGPNGEIYCEACFFDMYCFCYDCGEPTDREEVLKDPEGNSVCERCFSNNGYMVCEECEGVYDGCDMIETVFHDEIWLCKVCYEDFIESGTEEGLAEKFIYISENGNADDFTDIDTLEEIIMCWNTLRPVYCSNTELIKTCEDAFIRYALEYGNIVIDAEIFNVGPNEVRQHIHVIKS